MVTAPAMAKTHDVHLKGPITHNIFDYALTLKLAGGEASCFLVEDSSYEYLVTARHVLFYDSLPGGSHRWRLRSEGARLCGNFYGTHYEDSVFLGALAADGQIKADSMHDVAVVRLGSFEYDGKGHFSAGIALRHLRPMSGLGPGPYVAPLATTRRFDQIQVGSEILVVGYPTSLGLKQLPQLDFDLL
jgi:hypothetical protein